MRTLVVIGTVSGRGGIETCLRTVAAEAAATGDQLRIFALAPSTDDASWQAGLDYAEVPDGHPSRLRQAVLSLPALVRELRAWAPQAVVVIFPSTLPTVRAALLMAGLRVPVLAWLHFSAALTPHTGLLRLAHGQICISRENVNHIRSLKGIAPDSVHLVYNGTETDVAPVARSSGSALRIAHVGRLMVGGQKRCDELLTALSRVRGNWRLDMVGAALTAKVDTQLRAMTQTLGIGDRVRWAGWQADPWAALDHADVLVLCSSLEGFGMVLVEAMARGIACVSSNCPSGPDEIIDPGKNGWLYPVGDVGALTLRLQGLVDRETALPSPESVRSSMLHFGRAQMYASFRDAIVRTIDTMRSGGRRLWLHRVKRS